MPPVPEELDPPLQVILQSPFLHEVLRDLHFSPEHCTTPPHEILQTPLLQEVDNPVKNCIIQIFIKELCFMLNLNCKLFENKLQMYQFLQFLQSQFPFDTVLVEIHYW